MAVVSVNIGSSNQTIDESNFDAGDTVRVTAIGDHTLTIDGVDTTVNFALGVTLTSNVTFAAINGADVAINEGLLGLSVGSATTYNVGAGSSISVTPGLSVGLLSGRSVIFSGDGTSSFNYDGSAATLGVQGFGLGDSLNAEGSAFNNFVYNGGSGIATLTYGTGLGTVTFNITGMDPALAAEIAADPSAFINEDGALVAPVCFLAGTMIAVPGGERAVEELAIGDMVLTAGGETRPVLWIGRQTLHRHFGDPLRTHPIRIAAGALGDSLPTRDLFVSPDHALLLEGQLVQAGALVNGTTVVKHKPEEPRYTYYHIELQDHALVLAEGVAAETFVDNVTRGRFDNYAEYEALYGTDAAAIAEMDLPRVKSARQLPDSLRTRLAARAGGSDLATAAA